MKCSKAMVKVFSFVVRSKFLHLIVILLLFYHSSSAQETSSERFWNDEGSILLPINISLYLLIAAVVLFVFGYFFEEIFKTKVEKDTKKDNYSGCFFIVAALCALPIIAWILTLITFLWVAIIGIFGLFMICFVIYHLVRKKK